MAPSVAVTRPNTNLNFSSTPTQNLAITERFYTQTTHGFTEGQVLKRFPIWALACADLEENCGEYIILKTGPKFFDVAKYAGVYDFVSGFTNNDRGKIIYLDWRPANLGKMTLDEPPGFEYCQVLGKVIDESRILIRPQPPTICGGVGVGIINLNNHGILRGQIFDRDGTGVRLASTATGTFFLGNLIACRVTTDKIWYPTTPTEYTMNSHGWTINQIYYIGPTPGTPTSDSSLVPGGQNPPRKLPLFAPISADKFLYIRATQPV